MEKTVFTVGSVTYALRLRKLLTRDGIKSRLVKVDNSPTGLGCAHGVEISEGDIYSAIMILRNNGIQYSMIRQKNDLP